jgi:hypothetical protein
MWEQSDIESRHAIASCSRRHSGKSISSAAIAAHSGSSTSSAYGLLSRATSVDRISAVSRVPSVSLYVLGLTEWFATLTDAERTWVNGSTGAVNHLDLFCSTGAQLRARMNRLLHSVKVALL